MGPRATGSVLPPKGERRSWAIRFRAYGKRYFISLGRPEDGWNRERAEVELANVLADVRRGIWKPAQRDGALAGGQPEPTFGEFAEEWFEGASLDWRDRTRINRRWLLDSHLLPFFSGHLLSTITVREVDRYRRLKVRESRDLGEARRQQLTKPKSKRKRLPRPLSNGSINKTIRLLATILEQGIEYSYIDRNPAKGRKRLLRESKPSRSYLQPEQVAALLGAAAELDRDNDGRRQPLLAVLALAGLRISEALNLRWRDINLAERKLWVAQAKTDAGVRQVDLTPALQELLSEYRARTKHGNASDLVFATANGNRDNPSNVRNRFLAAAVEIADERLKEAGRQEIPAITPHSLRRTFISLLLAAGADVPYVMAQAGHSDPKMTLGIYAQVIASKTDHGIAMDGLISEINWAQTGQSDQMEPHKAPPTPKPKQRKTPR